MTRLLLLVPLLAALFLGCAEDDSAGPEPAAEPADGVEVTRVTLGTERGRQGRGAFFAPGDELVARVETRGHADHATLIVDWKNAEGRVIGHSSRSIAPDGTEVTEFHLSHPEDWPEGRYVFEVWLDGSMAATRSFDVLAGE